MHFSSTHLIHASCLSPASIKLAPGFCKMSVAPSSGNGLLGLHRHPRRNDAADHTRQKLQWTSPRSAAAAALPIHPTDEWQGVVCVAAGAGFLCNLHRSTFSVLLPSLQQQYELSLSQVGALQTAMLLAYLVGQLPSGLLADKLGGARVLLLGLAIWSLAISTCSAAPLAAAAPVAVLALSRLLFGLGSSCLMPAVSATAAQWVPLARKASSISFIYACFNVGGVAGFVIMPLLAELLGWPAAFLAAGVLGLLWSAGGSLLLAWAHDGALARAGSRQGKTAQQAAAAAATATAGESSSTVSGSASGRIAAGASVVADASSSNTSGATGVPATCNEEAQQGVKPAGSSSASKQSKQQPEINGEGLHQAAQQQQASSVGAEAAGPKVQLGPLSLPVRPAVARHIAVLCWAHAVIGWGFFILANWIPMYITSLGEGRLSSMGFLSALPSLSAAVFGLMSASIADRLIDGGLPATFVRRLFHGLASLGFALAVAPLALLSSPPVLLATACLTAASALYACSFGGFHAYLQDVVDQDVGVGLVQGLTNSCSIMLGIAGNLCTGWIVDWSGSYSAVFGLTCVLCSSSFLLWALFARGQRISLA